MFEPNAEQLQSVIISNDLITQISELRQIINDPDLGIEIDPLKIYCQKTGHIIGQRDENSLFSLAKIHGKNEIIPSLYHATSLNVHPAWINTDGETLDQLVNDDPIGYAVYCFGLITAQFYQNAKNTDKKRSPWIERYWAIARANALLTQRGISELPALNVELCKFLTYANDETSKNNPKSYLFKRAMEIAKTPDYLAMLAVTGELTPLLKECTNRALAAIGQVEAYIKQTRYVDYAATPADAARGPSNIKQQKTSRRDIKEAGLFAELSKLFDDSDLNIRQMLIANTPGTGAWKKRIEQNKIDNEAAMLKDLISIGGTNLDLGLIENEDEDDNAVEVRTISSYISHPGNETHNNPELTGETSKEATAIAQIITETAIRAKMGEIASAIKENIIEKPEIKLSALELIRMRKLQVQP